MLSFEKPFEKMYWLVLSVSEEAHPHPHQLVDTPDVGGGN